jgi:hypothetical protein
MRSPSESLTARPVARSLRHNNVIGHAQFSPRIVAANHQTATPGEATATMRRASPFASHPTAGVDQAGGFAAVTSSPTSRRTVIGVGKSVTMSCSTRYQSVTGPDCRDAATRRVSASSCTASASQRDCGLHQWLIHRRAIHRHPPGGWRPATESGRVMTARSV